MNLPCIRVTYTPVPPVCLARLVRASGLVALVAGCAPAEEADDARRPGAGGKADELEAVGACPEVFDGRNGFSRAVVDPTELRDPIAQFVLRAQGECPDTFAEVAAALALRDDVACTDAKGSDTALVSETSQVLGKPDVFRAIVGRDCGGRPEHGLAMSLANLRGDATEPPKDVELMAFDQTLGMFAFYTLQGGVWTFHGTSKDLVAEGSQSRCAACHVDGGMIMKELDTPWVHWEGDATTPGASELIDRLDDLGTRSTGAELEQTVLAGNREWTEIWIKDLLQAGELDRVLRPLFCSNEFNIGTAADGVGDPVRFVPAEALVDDVFDAGAFPLQINASPEAYAAAIAASKQRVAVGGNALRGPDGKPVTDTLFKLAFVQRARADQQFVERLVEIGVIDRELALDVLAVDFTRPVFSDARCDLLEHTPQLGELVLREPDGTAAVKAKFAETIGDCCTPHAGSGCSGKTVEACVCAQDDFCCKEEWDPLCVTAVSDRGCAACPGEEAKFATPLVELPPDLPQQIREGFIAELERAAPAEGSAAAQLLAHLKEADGTSLHPQRVAEFFAACNARPEAERVRDVLAAVSAARSQARSTPLFEHEATFPVDELSVAPDAALDPVTCELVEG